MFIRWGIGRRTEQEVESFIVNGTIIFNDQGTWVEVIGEAVHAVFYGNIIADNMSDRQAFAAEFKAVAAVVYLEAVFYCDAAVRTVFNLVEQIKTVIDVIVRVAVNEAISLSYAHFHCKSIGIFMPRIFISPGF